MKISEKLHSLRTKVLDSVREYREEVVRALKALNCELPVNGDFCEVTWTDEEGLTYNYAIDKVRYVDSKYVFPLSHINVHICMMENEECDEWYDLFTFNDEIADYIIGEIDWGDDEDDYDNSLQFEAWGGFTTEQIDVVKKMFLDGKKENGAYHIKECEHVNDWVENFEGSDYGEWLKRVRDNGYTIYTLSYDWQEIGEFAIKK